MACPCDVPQWLQHNSSRPRWIVCFLSEFISDPPHCRHCGAMPHHSPWVSSTSSSAGSLLLASIQVLPVFASRLTKRQPCACASGVGISLLMNSRPIVLDYDHFALWLSYIHSCYKPRVEFRKSPTPVAAQTAVTLASSDGEPSLSWQGWLDRQTPFSGTADPIGSTIARNDGKIYKRRLREPDWLAAERQILKRVYRVLSTSSPTLFLT